MIAHIANLVRWEWFKTQRRWMPWILLIIPLLFTQLTLWSTYFGYRAPISIDSGMSSSGVFEVEGDSGPTRQRVSVDLHCDDIIAGSVPSETPPELGVEDFTLQCRQSYEEEREKRRDMLERIILPGSVANALIVVHGFSVILIAIMTASLLGTEFGWGTLRMVLAKGTGRWQLLSAKLVLLALLAGAALVIITAATAVSSVVVASLVSERPEAPPEWVEVATTFGRTWFALLPYVALAGLITLVASSSVAGIATAVGYFFTEWVVAALLLSQFDWAQNVADYMLGRNITAWMMGNGGGELQILGTSTPIGEFPDLSHSFVVLAAYLLVLGGLAFWHFQRKDIGGASGA